MFPFFSAAEGECLLEADLVRKKVNSLRSILQPFQSVASAEFVLGEVRLPAAIGTNQTLVE